MIPVSLFVVINVLVFVSIWATLTGRMERIFPIGLRISICYVGVILNFIGIISCSPWFFMAMIVSIYGLIAENVEKEE